MTQVEFWGKPSVFISIDLQCPICGQTQETFFLEEELLEEGSLEINIPCIQCSLDYGETVLMQ